MSADARVDRRARTLGDCMRAARRPKPEEIDAEGLYARPGEAPKRSIRGFDQDRRRPERTPGESRPL